MAIKCECKFGKIVLLEICLRVAENSVLDIFEFQSDLRRWFSLKFLLVIVVLRRKYQIELKENIVRIKIRKCLKLHSKLYKIVKWNNLIFNFKNLYLNTWLQRLWSERTCHQRWNHNVLSFCWVCNCVDVGIRKEWQRSEVNKDVLLVCFFILCKWRLILMQGLDLASLRSWNLEGEE